MGKERPIYVLDTNVVIDYEDIIPSPDGPTRKPEKPTVDLAGAHIVIPSAVVRELSRFKGEKSERGKIARAVLKRLRRICEDVVFDMEDVYNLSAGIEVGDQFFSILPVHKNFHKQLPFHPSDTDMDGQIILTALTIKYLLNGLSIDGTDFSELEEPERKVVLLTNDNGLAIRARQRGIETMRYGHKNPAPYTGRREVVVPNALLDKFRTERCIKRELFEETLPHEAKLVANEFVVMHSVEYDAALSNTYDDGPYPSNPYEGDPYFTNIGKYDATKDAILPLKYATNFPIWPRNPGQAIYAEALMDPDIAAVICTGPAGSGKTYMATVYGYEACKDGQFIGVTVVPCESKSKIGALPGDLDEKMDPDVQPLKNALRNYLLHEDASLKKELANIHKYGATPPRTGLARRTITRKSRINVRSRPNSLTAWS